VARGYARYVLALMFGINLLNYLDRYVAASVAPMVQKELHLTDSQIGLFGTAFLLVYAIAALPFGYWADRGIRKNVIAVGVAIWSLATFFTGFARTYAQLFLSRAIVGIGEAGYYPAGTSLMSDYFPKEQRSRVMSVWGAGSTVGIALGFAGGGFLADLYGWRAAFFIVGIPGLLFALGAWRMREPLRGATEKGPSLRKTADAGVKQFFELLGIPTLRYTIIAQTLLFFVLASNAFWLPTILQRRFELSSTSAGVLAGGVIVVGGLIGTLAGGWIADRRAMTTPRAHLEVGIVGFLAGAVLVSIALLSPLNIGPIPVFVPAFLLGVVSVYLYAGPFTALSQNVVSPGLRASAVTALIFIAHVFGDSHAPFDVGLISDWLGGNLQLALLITSPTLLLAAAGVAALGLRTVKADTERMERDWEARGAEATAS
jgi:MFS transporter, Spinster family, sphingosine-1-phosphate transporter